MPDELWREDATAVADLVRSGAVSPRDTVEAAIARIEALNPRVNAVIVPLYDEALAACDQVDLDAPLAGVPILVKDASLQIEGTRYAVGLGALRHVDHRSGATTELAQRLQAAGCIILGKTNLPEVSSGVTTEPGAFGPTRNPWDLERTASGSSGGSAAAVAVGMVPLAHGADATGSLRYPASACGVATLKPTRGRVPSNTPFGEPDPLGVWSEFALARSIRDLRALLAVVGDAPSESVRRPAAARVGLLLDDPLTRLPLDPACVEAVEVTGRLLEELGHDVDVRYPPALDTLFGRDAPATAAIGLVGNGVAAEQLARIEAILGVPGVEGDLPAERLAMAAAGRDVGADEVRAGAEAIRAAAAPILDWYEDFDLLVTPTLRQPPWLLGSEEPGAALAGVFPAPFSFTGQPALSLPLHQTADGLPVGVQLVVPMDGDEWLLDVAASVEAAQPWRGRWPALATDGA